jgi:hypothetical protein
MQLTTGKQVNRQKKEIVMNFFPLKKRMEREESSKNRFTSSANSKKVIDLFRTKSSGKK